MAVADTIKDLMEPSINDLGFELWGVEFISSGKYSTLRIYIDSEQGIDAKNCETVSHQVSSILDVEDPITTAYNLEISSPGVDRPLFTLEHFHRFLGSEISLRLFRPIDGKRKLSGTIKEVKDNSESIILDMNISELEIEFSLIDKANLVVNF
jgi:ribosome maturation factor RimP